MTDTLHRWFAVHAISGEILAELPLAQVSVTDRLGAPSSMSASINNLHPAARHLNTETVELVATRAGQMLFAGPLLDINLGEGAGLLALQCEDRWNLVRRRLIRSRQGMTYATGAAGTVTFTGVDQFRIVADLIAHIQSISGGDLGITVAYDALSGVTRDRTYLEADAKFAGPAIEELAQVDGGFDWVLETSGTEDAIVRTLRLSPLRGRDTTVVFDWTPDGHGEYGGKLVLGFSVAESSRGRAQRVYATGNLVAAAAEDPNLLGQMPLVESTRAWMDVTVQSTINAHAARELALNKRAPKVVSFTVNPNAEPLWGTLILGDRVRAKVDYGWAQIDDVRRITGRTYSVDTEGRATAAYEMAAYSRFV